MTAGFEIGIISLLYYDIYRQFHNHLIIHLVFVSHTFTMTGDFIKL